MYTYIQRVLRRRAALHAEVQRLQHAYDSDVYVSANVPRLMGERARARAHWYFKFQQRRLNKRGCAEFRRRERRIVVARNGLSAAAACVPEKRAPSYARAAPPVFVRFP